MYLLLRISSGIVYFVQLDWCKCLTLHLFEFLPSQLTVSNGVILSPKFTKLSDEPDFNMDSFASV